MGDIYTTAKWGNRMLRPLTAIYRRLEKYRELQTLDTPCPSKGGESAGRCSNGLSEAPESISDSIFPDLECGENDPVWIPGPESRRALIKHRYTGKGDNGKRRRSRVTLSLYSPDVPRTLPGAIEISTPLIKGNLLDVHPFDDGTVGVVVNGDATMLKNTNSRCVEGRHQTKLPRQKPRSHTKYRNEDVLWTQALYESNDVNYVDIVRRLDAVFLKFLDKLQLPPSVGRYADRGTRSLVSMVLRRLPYFVAEEQRLYDEASEDEDIDMIDVYFTELEAAYGFGDQGWIPLREAVRFHGIFLVADMIKRNWITNFTGCSLIERCIAVEQYDAAEVLLSSLLSLVDARRYPGSFNAAWPISGRPDAIKTLHRFWKASGRNSFVFRELAKLLVEGNLPPEWMVTSFWKPCIDLATKSVSANDGDFAGASRLLEAVILSSARMPIPPTLHSMILPVTPSFRDRRFSAAIKDSRFGEDQQTCPVYIQDALSNLVASLVVAISGMFWVRFESTSTALSDTPERLNSLLELIATQIRCSRAPPSISSGSRFTVCDIRKAYVLVGHYSVLCARGSVDLRKRLSQVPPDEELELLLFSLSSQQPVLQELAALVIQIIRCSVRGTEREQAPRIRQIFTSFLNVEHEYVDAVTLFLGKVAVEIAMEFAQMSQAPEDHVWATEAQETFSRFQHQRRDSLTKSKSTLHTPIPYRWEDGIGEWVARTPIFAEKSEASAVSIREPMVVIREISPSINGSSTLSEGSLSRPTTPASSIASSVSADCQRSTTDIRTERRLNKRQWITSSSRNISGQKVQLHLGHEPADDSADEIVVLHNSERSSSLNFINRSRASHDGTPQVQIHKRNNSEHRKSVIEIVIPNYSPRPLDAAPAVAPHRQRRQHRPRKKQKLKHHPLDAPRARTQPCEGFRTGTFLVDGESEDELNIFD